LTGSITAAAFTRNTSTTVAAVMQSDFTLSSFWMLKGQRKNLQVTKFKINKHTSAFLRVIGKNLTVTVLCDCGIKQYEQTHVLSV